jgi:hypothetical protein
LFATNRAETSNHLGSPFLLKENTLKRISFSLLGACRKNIFSKILSFFYFTMVKYSFNKKWHIRDIAYKNILKFF